MANYLPGDPETLEVTITSPRGTVKCDGKDVTLMHCNIYESCLDHHSYSDLVLFDANDILGQKKFAGDEQVEITLKTPGSQSPAKYKFSVLQNHDNKQTGAQKGKSYTLRCASPEMLNSQRKVVDKGWNDKTSNIVKDVVKNYWDSEKEIQIDQETHGKQIINGNSDHPHEVIGWLKTRHVSPEYKKDGSAFSLFETRDENGKQIFKFTTFKKMMEDKLDLGFEAYTQSDTVGSTATSSANDFHNIINFNIPSSFWTPNRLIGASANSAYNIAAGKQAKKKVDFESLDQPISKSPIPQEQIQYINKPPTEQRPRRHRNVSPYSDKEKTHISESNPINAQVMARLQNDMAHMEVNGYHILRPGKVIKISVPKKADMTSFQEETQMTANVLICGVKHQIKPAGSRPRWTTVIDFIKAGFEEGV